MKIRSSSKIGLRKFDNNCAVSIHLNCSSTCFHVLRGKSWVRQVGRDCFNVDVEWPLSIMQAFAVCLSRFDTDAQFWRNWSAVRSSNYEVKLSQTPEYVALIISEDNNRRCPLPPMTSVNTRSRYSYDCCKARACFGERAFKHQPCGHNRTWLIQWTFVFEHKGTLINDFFHLIPRATAWYFLSKNWWSVQIFHFPSHVTVPHTKPGNSWHSRIEHLNEE